MGIPAHCKNNGIVLLNTIYSIEMYLTVVPETNATISLTVHGLYSVLCSCRLQPTPLKHYGHVIFVEVHH